MNRLAQFFPAPKPVTTRPEPAKGFDHFAIGQFDRFKLKTPWTPRNSEDAPVTVRYKDVTWQSRRELRGVADALRWVKNFNERRLESDLAGCHQWGLLAWVDGAYERLDFDFARSVTPFTYRTHKMVPQPDFRPTCLLEAPSATWVDTSALSLKDEYATIDDAVLAAVRANRKYRPGRKPKGGIGLPHWTVVLAFECDEVDEHGSINCTAGMGTTTTMTARRFHVVDATWPLAPETLAAVKGGGM